MEQGNGSRFLWIGLAIISLLHPHLSQKLGMLYNYFTHPSYQFWTTFSGMDVFDLLMHTAIPIAFFSFALRKPTDTSQQHP